MKTIIFFDLDNTIHNKPKNIIPPQTIKLIKELAQRPNTFLGLATGRGPYKVGLIDEIIHLFKYRVFINGALAYDENQLVYENPIDFAIVNDITKRAELLSVKYGLVFKNHETLNKHHIEKAEKVYQVWLFTKDDSHLKAINPYKELDCHPWHQEGTDLVHNKSNKAIAIKKLLKNETNYRLIAVGDGHNDIKMIEIADIGIAMGNSGFKELKEKAHFIAPSIDEDKLYDFFVKHDYFV